MLHIKGEDHHTWLTWCVTLTLILTSTGAALWQEWPCLAGVGTDGEYKQSLTFGTDLNIDLITNFGTVPSSLP